MIKFTKLLLALFLTITSLSLAANDLHPASKQTALRQEIVEYLRNANLNIVKEHSITIDFLINSENKIVVISNSGEDLENSIRNILNYKTIKTSDFEVNAIYTLPIKMVKK